MSSESAKAFLDKFYSDPTVRTELWKAAGATSDEVTLPLERLVDVAARRGFAFSTQEIVEAYVERGRRGDPGTSPAEPSSELTDDQLEAVAGGAIGTTESLSMNHQQLTFTYTEQDAMLDGAVRYTYDLKINKKV